jgi:hypothetical protein
MKPSPSPDIKRARPRARVGALAALVLTIAACVTSSQAEVSYPAYARPALTRTLLAKNGWTVSVSRAEIAFGPVYLCAAQSGSATLCETAVGELLRVQRIDALAGEQALGVVRGLEGPIRSAGYDLGITWFDTQTSATPAATAPDGHSIVVEGVATRGSDVVPFRLLVDAVPQFQGQRAVPTTKASGNVTSGDARLDVTFDVTRWLASVDFDEALARPERPALLDGTSTAHATVLLAIKALSPPQLSWTP